MRETVKEVMKAVQVKYFYQHKNFKPNKHFIQVRVNGAEVAAKRGGK